MSPFVAALRRHSTVWLLFILNLKCLRLYVLAFLNPRRVHCDVESRFTSTVFLLISFLVLPFLFGGCYLEANWDCRKSPETEHPASTLCSIDKNISSSAVEQEAEVVTWPAALFTSGSIQGILARLFWLWSVVADKMLLEESNRQRGGTPPPPFVGMSPVIGCSCLCLTGSLRGSLPNSFFSWMFSDKS